MIKIDPKYTAIFGLFTTILLAIGAGAIALPLGIPHDWLDYIKSWALFLGTINSAVLTGGAAYSSVGRGPLAPPPTLGEARDVMTDAGVAAKAQPLTAPGGKQ